MAAEKKHHYLTIRVPEELKVLLRAEVRRRRAEQPGESVSASDIVRKELFKLFAPKETTGAQEK